MAMTKHVTTINQAGAGTTAIVDDSGDKTSRLHYLFGSLTDAGTLAVTGTGGEVVVPAMELTADTPVMFGPFDDVDLAPQINKQGLNLVSTGGAFKGVAGATQGSPGAAAP